MRRYSLAVAGLVLVVGQLLADRAWALGTEESGNEPIAEANYTDWKGLAAVVNDKSRIYQNWVNGNEHFFYSGKAKELNAVLATFAKVEVENHVVVLRNGPATTKSFQGTVIPYKWQLHLVGGIAKVKAVDDVEDLDWQKDPVLTIYLGDGIDLKSLELPEGVRLAVRKEDEKQKRQQELIDYVAKWNEKQKKDK
jgi:hypothetical protein